MSVSEHKCKSTELLKAKLKTKKALEWHSCCNRKHRWQRWAPAKEEVKYHHSGADWNESNI